MRSIETGYAKRTKIPNIPKPMNPPAMSGDQYDMEGYDVHPNQKNARANIGAPNIGISRRCSGGTGFGAYRSKALL